MSFDVELATRSEAAPTRAEVSAVIEAIRGVVVRSVAADGSCVATIGDGPGGAPGTIEFSDEFLDDPDEFDGATLIGWVVSISYAADDAQVATVALALEELVSKLDVVAVDLQDESVLASNELLTRLRASHREVSGFLEDTYGRRSPRLPVDIGHRMVTEADRRRGIGGLHRRSGRA